MKTSAKTLLPLFFSLVPAFSYGEIYAQSGYEEGKDGILLLTEKCPGPAGEAGFKAAVIRTQGSVMQGCYIKNNRGNFVAKWQNGSIAEIPSNIFIIKEIPPKKPTPRSNCQELYQAWVFNKTLEETCKLKPGVAQNIGIAAKSACQKSKEAQRDQWGKEVLKIIENDLNEIGSNEFCRRNKPGHEELTE